MKGTRRRGKETRLLGTPAARKKPPRRRKKALSLENGAFGRFSRPFFWHNEGQRISRAASTYETTSFRDDDDDDLSQSIKTAIFHHGAEQPTESHIERSDPCMAKAQLGTRPPGGGRGLFPGEPRRRPRMAAYEIPQQRARCVRVFIWSMLASEYENKKRKEGKKER